jgi:ribosome-binding protein aMBF1 (putative translation factor)
MWVMPPVRVMVYKEVRTRSSGPRLSHGEFMMEDQKFASDGLKWLYEKYVKNDPESVQLFKEYEVRAEIAKQVYDLRNQAGLTSAELADLVNVGESVIAAIEQADYAGDALAMLVKIASALNKKLEVHFVPAASVESGELTP